jgi:hypothetical protein
VEQAEKSYLVGSGALGLRSATMWDAASIAANIRESDLRDLVATTDEGAESIILRNIKSKNRVFSVDFENHCVATVGVVLIEGLERSIIWMLGTRALDIALRRHGGARVCRSWLEVVAEDHEELFNIVPRENRTTIRWLSWLGFRPTAEYKNFRGRGHDCIELTVRRVKRAPCVVLTPPVRPSSS